jgi:hypothetical protein
LLKFGKLVDIEKLEKIGVNKNAEELAERILEDEAALAKELQLVDVRAWRGPDGRGLLVDRG